MGYYGGYQTRIRFGAPLTRAVKALLIANGVVFAVQVLFYMQMGPQGPGLPAYRYLSPFERLFALTPALAIGRLHVWQFITYSFLHDVTNLWHILMNMFMLWMFGGDVESPLGQRRFLKLYFGAALAGGLCMVPWYFFASDVPVLGASAAVFGVMAMFARLYPERRLLVWGILPVRAKTLVLVLAGLDLLLAVQGSRSGTAHLAHVGGFVVGWFFVPLERGLDRWRRKWRQGRAARRERTDREMRSRVDTLLAKVGREGLGSLSESERRFLNEAGKKFDR
jgi:membrane associated rhomboid family serine protease